MTKKPAPDRPGPLNPKTEGDDVVVQNPLAAPMHMSAEEADLSGIRMLEQAAEARENHEKGERE